MFNTNGRYDTGDTPAAMAFNEGCDARLLGQAKERNPYFGGVCYEYWNLGWEDVHRHWGRKCQGEIKQLPEVCKCR